MGNALVCLMCVVIIVVGVMTLMDGSFRSVDIISSGHKAMEANTGDISRTDISNLNENTVGGGGADVTITIKNKGEVSLLDFSKWDAIIQYYSSGPTLNVRRLTYVASGLGNNQWTVEGIYIDASASTAEVYEQDIFNPGEEMKMQLKLSPVVAASTTNRVTVSTPTGVTAEVQFAG